NNFNGSLPADIDRLSPELDLGANGFSVWRTTISFHRRRFRQSLNLTVLYLYQNELTGEIPKSILVTNIVELDLSYNNLTGSIPDAIGNLTKLEYLHLHENHLTGVIPAAIAKLPLEAFEVSENQLTGKIPENLRKGGKLLGVVVFLNNLTGVIPESLGNCGSLLTVQLYNNRFTGEFPSGMWTARDMYSLQVSNKLFTGKLPEKFAWNLSRIDIDNNEFSGEIPSTVSTVRQHNMGLDVKSKMDKGRGGPSVKQVMHSESQNRGSTAPPCMIKRKENKTKPATKLRNRYDTLLSLCDD
ncbi:hypothetical protein F2Q70_00026971, partial [Brassica cretica]